MERRSFLAALAAFALDPERALWVPGARTISIAAPRNLFMAPHLYTRSMLLMLETEWMVQRAINREYGEWFGRAPKIGDTISVRTPARFHPPRPL